MGGDLYHIGKNKIWQYYSAVFIRIVATATINFFLARVRLLIEGGSYSRSAFINLIRRIPRGAIHENGTDLRGLYFKQSRYDRKVIGHATVEPCQARLLHVSALNERLCTACDCSHTHLIVYAATIRGRLLFLSASSRCGCYSRAATIRGAALWYVSAGF